MPGLIMVVILCAILLFFNAHIMISALEVSQELDLRPFSSLLDSKGVRHRITLSGDQQVVWVADQQEKQQVEDLFLSWQRGSIEMPNLQVDVVHAESSSKVLLFFVRALKHWPATLVLLLVTVLIFVFVMGLGEIYMHTWLSQLTLVSYRLDGDYIYFSDLSSTMAAGEYWRLFSPMLIHFSWMHLVFNMLWFWEVGRRIEVINGTLVFLLMVAVASLVSNMAEYLMTGPVLFGGMSGVVFALLSHSFVWSYLRPGQTTGLPPGIYIFLVVYLALGFTGAMDILGEGTIANWAHLGGLLSGLFTGWLAATVIGHKETSSTS